MLRICYHGDIVSDEVEVEHLKTLTKDDVIDFYHVS